MPTKGNNKENRRPKKKKAVTKPLNVRLAALRAKLLKQKEQAKDRKQRAGYLRKMR